MILERFKQKRQDSNSTSQEDQSSQPPVTRAIITSEYLAGETNGQEFARIAWPKITMVTLKIEADENGEPHPFWYIGDDETTVRLPNHTENIADLMNALSDLLPHFDSELTHQEIQTALMADDGRYDIWQLD